MGGIRVKDVVIAEDLSLTGPPDGFYGNAIGTAVYIDSDDEVLVEFHENIGGHSGQGLYNGEPGHCWFCDPEDLRVIYRGKNES